MEVVGAALIDVIGDRAAAAAVLRTVGVRQDRELLNGSKIGGLVRLAANSVIVVVLPVNQKVVRARPRAVHGVTKAVRKRIVQLGVLDARKSRRGLGRIEAVVGKVFNFRRSQALSELPGLGV